MSDLCAELPIRGRTCINSGVEVELIPAGEACLLQTFLLDGGRVLACLLEFGVQQTYTFKECVKVLSSNMRVLSPEEKRHHCSQGFKKKVYQ